LDEARTCSLDFVVLPIAHPRFERASSGLGSTAMRAQLLGLPFTRSDVLLNSNQWQRTVVGQVSRWIRFDDATRIGALACERALDEELAWAAHLGLPAVLLPMLTGHDVEYARAVNHQLVKHQTAFAMWIEVSMDDDGWRRWNAFRRMTGHSPALHCALVVPDVLPGEDDGEWEVILERWCGEPVKVALFPTSCFIANQAGYPTLGARHRRLFEVLYLRKVQFVIRGRPRHANGLLPYPGYLVHLGTRAPAPTEREEYEAPYYDYLQSPLQPLGDNLSSGTYEVFEQDPVKYTSYQLAVEQALLAVPDLATGRRLVVMVVGAGRGPLVRAALRAAERVGLESRVFVYCVEKNPNAVVTLLNAHRSQALWKGRVQVVSTDMRSWEAPEKADVIVSELLGSWGDNELSPECLGGVERFLRPTSGVSVPSQYTSFVAPILAPRLFSMLRAMAKSQTDFSDAATAAFSLPVYETCYVCRLHTFFEVAEAQACFTFVHAPRPVPLDNACYERHITLNFEARCDAMVHGFAGYFETVLYRDVALSILPSTYSTGMISWFPLFIPLAEPLFVTKGTRIEASFWRRHDERKVWVEWQVRTSLGACTAIHNPAGRSSWINL